MLKNYLLKKMWFSVIYFVTAIFTEIVLFVSLGEGVFPQYFVMELALMALLAGLIFALPGRVAPMCVSLFLIAVHALLCCVNFHIFCVYGDLFTFDLHVLLSEAGESMDTSFIHFDVLFGYIAIVLAAVAAELLIFFRKQDGGMKWSNRRAIALSLCIAFCVCLLSGTAFSVQKGLLPTGEGETYDILHDDKFLYESGVLEMEALRSFGVNSFYLEDIKENLFGKRDSKEEKEAAKEFLAGSVAKKNAFTGTMEGYNVITVMLESFEWYVINEEFTPNLWKLAKEGLAFENNVSKNKTNHSEGVGILGSYPSMTALPRSFGEKKLPFSLPNMLKEEGVVSRFFHDNEGAFYSREYTHPAFGFDELVFPEDVGLKLSDRFGEWPKDSEFVDLVLDKMAPSDERFYSFFTTVSTHGPFDGTNVNMHENYEKLGAFDPGFDELTNEAIRWYQAAAMDTDLAIGKILEHLETTRGYDGRMLIDSTLIVLYADHNAYYYDMNFTTRGLDPDSIEDKLCTSMYRVPFIVYGKALEGKDVPAAITEQATCSYNIVPTVLDLLGVAFSPNCYLGFSLFDEENLGKTVLLSNTDGFLNDKILTRDGKTPYSMAEGTTKAEQDAFFEACSVAMTKQKNLDIVYRNNLYA